MLGTPLTFRRRIQSGTDDFNNATFNIVEIVVEDCLVAPISEPASAREQQAITQGKDQLRVHLPKSFTDDISGSEFAWDGKVFCLDSDSVVLMAGNTPTRWNRYFRAEYVSTYQAASTDGIFVIYYGTSSELSLNTSEVIALQNNTSQSQLLLDYSIDGSGEYLYFAYPVEFGTALVRANGFVVSGWEIDTVTVSSVDYYVYRSQYAQHGDNIQIELATSL